MDLLSYILVVTNLLFFWFTISYGVLDSITPSQRLSDGDTIVSREGNFALGFFSPGSSKNRYLGIWYKNIPVQTVVWVANKVRPINDSSGILMIVEILPQSQTSVMNDFSTCREIKCRARSLKCENEFLYISLINSVLYILDTEG